MDTQFKPVIDALDALSQAIEKSTSDDRSMLEMYGWNQPAGDRHDLRFMVDELKRLIIDRAPQNADDDLDVAKFVNRIALIQAHQVPQLFNGNGVQAAPAFIGSINMLRAWIEHTWPAVLTLEPEMLPAVLARQVRAAKSRLDTASAGLADIEAKLALISSAHQAAESLPTDLDELRHARNTLVNINGQSATDAAAIKGMKDEVDSLLEQVKASKVEATLLVENCEDAYQITTTQGLAAAFEVKANSLSESIRWWVGGLTVALLAVAGLGYNRIHVLTAILAGEPKWGTVTLNFLLSAISVGAPLWFAWIATKQIGQRFRLAEDYSFKASVAKAYEGYRKQAVRIDPKFEARLFDIALSRLDEAPLRMVESESHGSPWHEALSWPRKNKKEEERKASDVAEKPATQDPET